MPDRPQNRFETTDRLLITLLSQEDEGGRARAIESLLLEHALPVIMRVVTRSRVTVREEDIDDIISTVNLRLVHRLREPLESHSIASFADYVAAMTYNVIYDFLRSRYPHRTRLKNRIRYVLTHDARFAKWELAGEMIAGLAEWKGREPHAPPAARELPVDPVADPQRTAKAIASVLALSGAPVLLDDLVRVLAELWNVTDAAVTPFRMAATEPRGAVQVEARQYLAKLWTEICDLRPPQRAALLLNLRDHDGANALGLLLMARIARNEEIAEAIGISADRLTELWNDLPLDDLRIASMLGMSRQQVINLRKAARARLFRRMNQSAPKP